MPTILVVDEIPMMRELAALFLSRLGRVITAEGGESALDLARREQPDVIVTDLDMPGVDGITLCRSVKSDDRLARTPVLVLSASDRGEDRERAIRAGADDVLAKPIQRVDLLQSVRRFFRSPTPLGQPRIELEAPVRLWRDNREVWGTARNLSRGGLFVESSGVPPPRSELGLELHLPDTAQTLSSTVLVIWKRDPTPETKGGAGMRFLALDGPSARSVADYVEERLPLVQPAWSPAP